MKLTIERLTTLTPQDRIDLAKIWPQENIPQWEPSMNEENMLFIARFNARLLAAVKVSIKGKQAELTDLHVRDVTRRRGVGLYLVQDIQAQLPEITVWIMQYQESDEVLGAFMQACGFVKKTQYWQHNTR